MKKISIPIFAVLVLITLFSGCSTQRTEPQLTQNQIDTMIGQMVMVGFRGLEADENSEIAKQITMLNIGGVVLFDYDVNTKSYDRNIESPAQLKKLIDQLNSYTQQPLFVAVDQEGGKVCRLKETCGFKPMPSAALLGSMNSTSLTYDYAKNNALMLKSLGVNMNFAPGVDLNVNPDNPIIAKMSRSYSENPDVVAKHAAAFIKAHHESGVLCCIKHFPGHGSSKDDSHSGFVDVTDTWSDKELKPYKKLIRQDIVDAVMSAHIFNSRLDPNYPATLSDKVIDSMLRDDLGYDGVVFSDDIQMGAISENYGFDVAVERCIYAGVDVILIANNYKYDSSAPYRAVQVIKNMIEQGKIGPDRIKQSYDRIMRLKEKIQVE